MRQSVAPFVAALCVLLAGCTSSEEEPPSGFTRTDSAGVTIATSHVSHSELRPVFTVAAEPTLKFGVESGAEELMFHGIQSAVRLDDGRIAVINRTPLELSIFSPQGEFITRLGRFGFGPGEFLSLGALFPGSGDTLYVVNSPLQLLRYTVQGGYVSMIAARTDSIRRHLGELQPTPGTRDVFVNGAVLTTGRVPASGSFAGSDSPTGELFRATTTLLWVDRNYARSRTVGDFGQTQQMIVDLGEGRRETVVPPSARRPSRAAGARGTRSCHANNEEPEVRCIDDDGTLLIIRWHQEPAPTLQTTIDEWRERIRRRAAAPGSRTTPQEAERTIAAVTIPPTLPPITSMVVDANGRLLVHGPDMESGMEGWRRHRVFSRDGELVGVADVPPITVHELGSDYLLGVMRNEHGIESVVVHHVFQAVGVRAGL